MLATSLKQLPSAVDQIPLPDVWELFEHWTQWPPEHILLRGFVGYEPPRQVPKVIDPDAAKQLAKYAGMGLAVGNKAPAHITEMVKWAEQMKSKLGVSVGNT